MTTIIGRKLKDGTLEIAGDKRTTLGCGIIKDGYTKILNLDGTLVGKYGDSISYEFFKELFERWKCSIEGITLKLETISDAINFFNFVKVNSNIKDHEGNYNANIGIIFLNHNFQIHIGTNSQVEEMDSNGLLFGGSGSDILHTFNKVITMEKFKYDVSFADYFEIVSSMDPHTSRDYDVLKLLPNINIEMN